MNTYSKLWRNTSFMQLIMTLFLVEFVRGALLISFIPKFAVSVLQLSVGVVGAAISAHYVADTLAKTVIGYLLDRYSIRLVVPAGLFLALIGFVFLLNSFHNPRSSTFIFILLKKPMVMRLIGATCDSGIIISCPLVLTCN
jgi:sugar phosphate permease